MADESPAAASAIPAEPVVGSVSGRRHLEFLVVLAVAGFVAMVAIASIWVGFGSVWHQMTILTTGQIAGLLGLSLVNYGLRCWRWQRFSDGLGLQVGWTRNALYYVTGFAMTATPGKAGEALRLWFLERCHGISYVRALPMFLADRLSDMVAILFLCTIGVGAFSGFALHAGVALAGTIGLLLLFLRPSWLLGLLNLLWGLFGRRAPRLFGKTRGAIRDTARLLTVRLFGVGFLISIVGWFAEGLAFYLLLDALDAAVSLQAAIFVFTFAMIAGTLAMLPGGLGGTEAVMLGLLAVLTVDSDRAVAATAVIRLTTLWFASGLGFLALPLALRLARHGRARIRPAGSGA